jgi:hypothetical protein
LSLCSPAVIAIINWRSSHFADIAATHKEANLFFPH